MRFEQRGIALPGWHWPALIAPAVWAFYRKLWLPGIALHAAVRLLGLAGFLTIEADLSDSDGASLACGAALVWLLPWNRRGAARQFASLPRCETTGRSRERAHR